MPLSALMPAPLSTTSFFFINKKVRTKIRFCAIDLSGDQLFYRVGKECKVGAKKALGFLCLTSMERLFLLFRSSFFGSCLFRGGFLCSGFLGGHFLRRSLFNGRCFGSGLRGCFC